ncbi:ABC transporter related protein [Arcobacter nitrofigilis DSM 7299]|uniref:ABC transporter related protein n=1 Tax=Arcobacter nitrofigilis (strain ATCC 33309 / DSM 7299 / CCUG 15893 / LMG 7604 / NCTC 12251 / CI) TaxID=572480 RepID=D5V6K7_ARCNC|nr:ATP-binding cassette domain-containing protein [Arcobacter nitrofigilis]ADG94277.1 ABC transporter related protein [Arcobacter nitrofigilis DSM 7299]
MAKIIINKLQIKNNNKELVNLSFEINKSMALIGESGSGKSLTLKAILNLLPSNLESIINIEPINELDKKNIGFIPQNPFTSLSPMTKISKQFFCEDNKKQEVLKLVGLEGFVLNRFPTQLSGGQLQRVVIAIAISQDPKLLLLDEPTTALDTKNKEIILELLENLIKKLNLKILYVTHDIFSIKNLCEDIIILKNGKIIESGKTKDVLSNAKDEYTIELINSNFINKKFREA